MDESSTPEEPSAADLQQLQSQVDELKAQIKALEERRMHCFYEMLPQPKKFKGTTADRKNRVVHDFLANFENYVKAAKLDDDHKIAILRTYLDGPAANLFNEAGEFKTYEAAKQWLIENFIPERSMFERTPPETRRIIPRLSTPIQYCLCGASRASSGILDPLVL
jgi:flagellar biosynthesis chaperone FliJ